ncbi:MAG: dihydrolipoyl dehydrogenase [endosymbiont of Galathealinum brachiosum]|uniref:Dihydrolipoyl dehydrogenase n=1 Tax=endosymbiont of Galathealinum brachiosum TaxID=2200906 RepID=A0A370DBV9_9GAMM|nr:MAG: dihydrolipoyl dehydrogenase [endosymbiont of Galathealinum brachiosum]
MREVEVAIIGAGSAGLYCMSQVKRFTNDFVLIDGGELGTTCARVGCMPSKVMIQIAEDFHRRTIFDREGIEGKEHLSINEEDALEHVQDLRDTFVDMTLSNSIDLLPEDKLIESYVRFIDSNTLETSDGDQIKAKRIIIATGSRPIVPDAWSAFSDKILTSDEVFELEALPDSIAVIGLGVIGLEIGQSLNRLGVNVTGIDQQNIISGLDDAEVNKVAIEVIGKEFPLWLGEAADIVQLENGNLQVNAGDKSIEVEKIFASMGRRPNVDKLNLEATGLELSPNGVPAYNPNTMQLGNSSIYMAGDCNADKPILHEAGFEGRVAGYNIMQDKPVEFKTKTPLAITFCEPNIVSVGARLSELDESSISIGEVKMAPVGRALIMGKNRGLIRLYADKKSGKLLGASMACVKGENLGHLICWCIEMEMTVPQMLRMPFYHPVIEEALQAALYNLKSKLEIEETHWPLEIQPLN